MRIRDQGPKRALGCALAVALWAGLAAPGRAQEPVGLADKYPAVRALVAARGACVVLEYYRKGIGPATRSPVYSVAKSVLSILIGVAVDRGRLRLDEKLGELMPETLGPGVDPEMREVTVADLLTMTGGFTVPAGDDRAMSGGAWRRLLDGGFRYPPGSRFQYDGRGPKILSVALTRAMRRNGGLFARDSLFAPLGVRNYAWKVDGEGHLTGDTDLSLTARDMARIGLLTLQGGRWGAAQIVSGRYIASATTRLNEGGPPFGASYGYLWWIGRTRSQLDAWFAAGQNGQLIAVVPGRNLVVAIAADAAPAGNLDLLDEVVLPKEAALPATPPCAARLAPDGAR